METPTPAAGREPLSLARVVRAGLLLTFTLAGTAVAAPCAVENCGNAARDQVPVTELAIRAVDLGDSDGVDDASAVARLSESMAPLLYLTPRVTSILEEVFEDSAPVADAGDAEAAAPPVADTDVEESAAEHYGPLSRADNAYHLPKFQRQMYRTDI